MKELILAPNEVTSADGAEPLQFVFGALRRATAEFYRSAMVASRGSGWH